MKTSYRGFAFGFLLLSSQRCVLPEVELAHSTVSPHSGQAAMSQTVAASEPAAAPVMNDDSTSASAPGSADVPRAGAAADMALDASAAMPALPHSASEASAMAASMPAKAPGGFKAACDSHLECQAKLLCHKGLCKRDNGEPCESDGECAHESCYRTCRAPLEAGGVCDSEADCINLSRCMMNTCRLVNGLACAHNYQCASGSCVAKLCAEPAGRLSPCQSDANCGEGLTCLRFASSTPSSPYCESKGYFPRDAICSADTDCVAEATCTSNNVCGNPVGEGQTCDSDRDCPPDLRCNGHCQ